MDQFKVEDSLTGIRTGVGRCVDRVVDASQLPASVPAVSAWSVQDHLEHLLLSDRNVLRWVVEALVLPSPEAREHLPREIGVTLLARGSIPRGRGPAPEFTLPVGLKLSALGDGFGRLSKLIDGLGSRTTEIDACQRTLPHHVLGHFTPAEWLRFLHLHHRHHEAIIRDILAA